MSKRSLSRKGSVNLIFNIVRLQNRIKRTKKVKLGGIEIV